MFEKKIGKFAFILWVLISTSEAFGFERPKLLVLIVVDQFRADYLSRFKSQFLPPIQKNGKLGGFRYLMSKGAYYPQGKYDVLQSVTSVGHMTVSTGSYPYQSGIVNNEWYDREEKKVVYCAEDSKAPLIQDESHDPEEGRSPKRLIGSTIGDQLKLSFVGSRTVSLALKDRAAILLAGHTADLALWFNKKSRKWTSSEYYLPSKKLPSWVNDLNQKTQALLKPLNGQDPGGTIASPVGNAMTADAVEIAFRSLGLGRGKATDLFAVSLSSHDVAGHLYGPNSPEMEAMTLSDDRSISRILNAIQKATPGGLKDVVIVLSGDHGVAPNEDWSKLIHLPYGKINTSDAKDRLNSYLVSQFGKPSSGSWVIAEMDFQFYLNQPEIKAQGIELAKIEGLAKEFLSSIPGVAHVFTSTDYLAGRLPPGKFERQILHSHFWKRSGNLVLIPQPFVIPAMSTSKATNHITGYSYDQTVPILFSGMHINQGIYANSAEVIDIAPTLAFLAGVIPPSSSEGRVLSEILVGLRD